MATASNPIATFPKDPSATSDFSLDGSRWLNGDVFTSVSWTVPAGISKVGETFSGTTMTIWLSGGVAGTSYIVAALFVTAGGRTDERSIQINVLDR